jgi:hypothetical protein
LENYRRITAKDAGVRSPFSLYNLSADGYDRINRSELVPELDFDLLTRCVLMNSIGDAALEFERTIGQN